MVSASIARIDGWLAVNRPDYYGRLRPGATEGALDAFESRFSLRLPESFRSLYHWRDGQQPACSASLQSNRMFSSLDEIAETKGMLDGMIGTDFEDPRWWRRGWVPFLANGGGDHLCLDVAAEDGGTPGQLIAFWHDEERRPVEYTDVESWLRQLADSMESGTLELA
jgi:cell wall assembly regulator SMI1